MASAQGQEGADLKAVPEKPLVEEKRARGKESKPKEKEKEKEKAAPPAKEEKEELFLSCSLAITGRSPTDGWIMSLGFCAMTLQKQIVDVFSENLLPLAPGASIGAPDVLSYWRSNRDELVAVLQGAKPPAMVFQALIAWAKALGKSYNLTLLGNPILTVFAFLNHYMNICVPDVKTPPWGFSGTCVKSFCCGVLGVLPKSLNKDPRLAAWAEGLTLNMIPANDCVVGAVTFVNALRDAMKLPPAGPFTWAANVNPPPCFGRVPRAIDLKVFDDAVQLPFARYPSIVDPTFDASLLREKNPVLESQQWVVTEKVHGTNISVITDGTHIRVGRRTGLLKESNSNSFFSFDLVVGRLMPNILKVHSSLSADPSLAAIADESGKALRLGSITVFGELAGGEYAHPLVAPDILGHKVQSGVQYAPFNFFYAFDIALNYCLSETAPATSDAPATSQSVVKSVFLPFDRLCQVLDAAGILRAQEKFRGSFSEAMSWTPVFNSDLPSRFGLPALSSDNHAEGIVIRPVNDVWLEPPAQPQPQTLPPAAVATAESEQPPTDASTSTPGVIADKGKGTSSGKTGQKGWSKRPPGKSASLPTPASGDGEEGEEDSVTHGPKRVLFKRKHPKFSEMVTTNAPSRDAAIDVIALSMINEGRLASVLSKLTLDERANSEKVAELLVLDAIADAEQYKAKALNDKGKPKRGGGNDADATGAATDVIPAEARVKLLQAAKGIVRPPQ